MKQSIIKQLENIVSEELEIRNTCSKKYRELELEISKQKSEEFDKIDKSYNDNIKKIIIPILPFSIGDICFAHVSVGWSVLGT